MALDAPSERADGTPVSARPVLLLLLVAVLARAWIFFNLDTVVYWWRPAENAGIARNFLENGFRFFYPQVDWGGTGPGYVEMEFPVLQYVTALLYAVFGFHEELAVLIPLVAALGAVAVTYRLGRLLVGEWPARIAALVLALSTSFIRYSQTFLGETLLVWMVVSGLYAYLRWIRGAGLRHYWLAAGCLAMAALIKPTALVIGLPMAYLAWRRFRWRAVVEARLWALAAVILGLPALWYLHAFGLGAASGNSVGILSGGYLKLARTDLLTSAEFYLRQAWFVAMYHLTPVLVFPLVLGVFTRGRGYMVHAWVLAGVVQVFVAAEGNFASPYHQLIMLPALAMFVGVGLTRMVEVVEWRMPREAPLVLAALGVVIVASHAATLWRSHQRSDFVSVGRGKARDGRLVGARLTPGRPIIYAALDRGASVPMPRGAHATPPDIFYFSGHHGWFLALDWISVEDIEALKGRGARYFVISEYWGGERSFLERERSGVWRHLVGHYPRVIDEAGVLAFDLNGPAQLAE
jgi:4-amino-4-deoxy-L-arabinose transferase-like glycosyltransferase